MLLTILLALHPRPVLLVTSPIVPRSRSRSALRAAPPADSGDLAARLRRIVEAAPSDRPLPTTREFGERFGVANTTVFRALNRLTEQGQIWQHPINGRYYPATARVLLDRPKPVACLIRRLELGSALYRELLEGISAGCGARHRTMLLWHDELLVNHPDPHEPPAFAAVGPQRTILQEFLARHGASAGGFVLDHIWSDDALRTHLPALAPAVVLFRQCDLEGISNVRADFRAGALKALAHLLGRGFERIIPVEPFAGDAAVQEFFTALDAAADELDCRNRLQPTVTASTARERATLVDRLRRVAKRTALLCPEDHVSALLLQGLREARIRCPDSVGVLSVMGTDAGLKAGLSCLRYDYRELGRRAVQALGEADPVHRALEPQFVAGSTT